MILERVQDISWGTVMYYRLITKMAVSIVVMLVFKGELVLGAEDAVCAGCKTEYYLIEKVADVLNKNNTDYNYKAAKTGNKKAIELMMAGDINFAFTCKDHFKLAKKFGIDKEKIASWHTVAIAHDPIIVVANPDCGISSLSMEQLCGIFSGTIKNWKDAGGPDKQIKVGYLDDSVESGVVTVFKETSIGEEAELTSDATLLKAPGNLGNFCNVTPGAVVFMGMNSYKPEYGTVLSINEVKPEVANVVSGKYPLAVTYHIIYDGNNARAAENLLKFMAGEEGKKITNDMMIAIAHKEIRSQ